MTLDIFPAINVTTRGSDDPQKRCALCIYVDDLVLF